MPLPNRPLGAVDCAHEMVATIKENYGRAGLEAKSVAERSGVPLKSLYGYLAGKTPNPHGDAVHRIATKALGISEQELRYGLDDEGKRIADLKKIPLLDMNKLGTLRNGQPPVEVWNEVSLMSVQSNSLSEQAFGLVIEDESGLPDIKPGEVLVFDPEATLVPGKLTLAVLKDQKLGVIGRYRPLAIAGSTHFTIVTLNPDYPDVKVDDDNPGFVVARAVQHIRKLD